MGDERTPLLQQFPGQSGSNFENLGDEHEQFCRLVGLPPFTQPPGQKFKSHPESLYYRATQHRRMQSATYMLTATITNSLLLSQVVLGAALTGLGASDSSRVLITVFGALNTVIAGVIAFLKSRGQPVRARMFRDDLDRVVDEIENSAVMWLGISRGAHGYDAIDTDDQVTVRSEVARLTRLYDRAVKINSMNDPDNYAAGQAGDQYNAGLRTRPGQPGQPPMPMPAAAGSAAAIPAPVNGAPVPPAPALLNDPDEAPATKAPEPTKPKDEDSSKDDGKAMDEAPKDKTPDLGSSPSAGPAPAKADEDSQSDKNGKAPVVDPVEPVTAALPEKHSEDTSHHVEDRKED